MDKGFVFAQTFVSTGTYGYSGGNPSADTQPLYGFFLIPLEWLFGMSWPAVGIAQTVIAIATAWIVYEIGRGWLTAGIGLAAAMASTLHPYMVWHDVHVAREVLDSLLAAALVLATLVAARRRSVPTAALAGAATGLAALGNVRLTSLAIVLAMYLLYAVRPVRRSAPLALALLLAAALVLSPWVMRNRVQVGCYSITTHAEGFWKANSEETYRTLAAGGWIDDVPSIAAPADECERMRFFQERVFDFWRTEPGEKARLALLSAQKLWDPRAARYELTVESSVPPPRFEVGRAWLEGSFMTLVYVLALVGVFSLVRSPTRRAFPALGVIVLGFGTAMAMVFVGTTRYRVAWDFVPMLFAAAGTTFLIRCRRSNDPDRNTVREATSSAEA